LDFRAGSMSRDASSSAPTNRSYLSNQKLFSASLTKELECTVKCTVIDE